MAKMTRLNPDRMSYRVPLIDGATFRFDSGPAIACVMGTVVDRLGEFEKFGIEPEELGELLKRHGYNKK